MPRDVGAYLFEQQSKSPPEIAQKWTEFEQLYNKKLWHQVTLNLLEFVKSPHLQQGDALVQLYDNFLADFETKINPLSLVEIIFFVVKQIRDYDQYIEFLAKIKEKVKSHDQAFILCNVFTAQAMLINKDMPGVKKIIEELSEQMEALNGVTPVHGRYYQLCSDYHQAMGNHADYYREALRYLGCTDLKDISIEEQNSRAFALCLAALLGEGVYNFGELLAHDILKPLKETDKGWVVELLFAFNCGSLARYEELKPYWINQPDLASHNLPLRQKISLLCLMELTFKRPGNQRQLTFGEIASETRLPDNEVELLVMKALSLGLVRGTIDQVEKKVLMTWVQPRVLDKNQLGVMLNRLDLWCRSVKDMEVLLEKKAQDILI